MAILLQMIFCHIIDDFVLQSAWLANGKQRDWWKKNAPEPMYRYDFIVALLAHAFSWSFMIMLPIMIANHGNVNYEFVIFLILNMLAHATVDNSKANQKHINLIVDQAIHLLQIYLTWIVFGVRL